jgi:putative membrane protein
MYRYGFMWGMHWFWLFPVLIVIVLVLVLWRGSNRPPSSPSTETPAEILRRRYAAGEISTEEYKERLAVLEGRR